MPRVARPPQITSKPLFLATCVVGALLWFGLLTVNDYEDVLRAYPSPERHRNVQRFTVDDSFAPEIVESWTTSKGDFNGDGIPDRLFVHHMSLDPFFDRRTNGMVTVTCGRTEETLLAHRVAGVFNQPAWIGDYDGNGTNDLFVRDNCDELPPSERRLVFSYTP